MSSNWLTSFDLFLRTKGTDDVQLWRLKNFKSLSSASLLITRLTPDDFEFVSEVKDHMELIGNMFGWNITDYKDLINYISTRRLLVNGESMAISEVFKCDEDGNIDPKELPVYILSPDALFLKTYIPTIWAAIDSSPADPSTTTKEVKSALQDELDNVKRDKQILVERVTELEDVNKALESEVVNLKADLQAAQNK